MSRTDSENTVKPKSDASYRHVIKYTGLFGGVQGIIMLVHLIRNKIAAVLLGPAGIALVSIYNKVSNLISQATNFGISFSAVKHIAELNESEDRTEIERYVCVVRSWCMLTALLGTLVMMVLASQLSLLTFENYDYTWQFVCLSPFVGLLALTGGEVAILKGLKQLKQIALISVMTALSTLLICTSLYYFFEEDGIIPALLLTAIAILGINLRYSTRVVSWRTSLTSMKTLAMGLPMVRLGVAYIIAGIFGQGADWCINVMMLHDGSLTDVGLYYSGYTLMTSYASVVFLAIEADFFPRLSGAVKNPLRQNHIINQQIEVCSLLTAPLLILFVFGMPILLQLLYSSKFIDAVPMAICASIYMFFKVHTTPLAYLSLANGDSKIYMIAELLYDLFVVAAIPFAFRNWGLMGAGLALSVAGVFDFILIHVFYHFKYKFVLNWKRTWYLYTIQLVLLLVTVYCSLELPLFQKLSIALIALICSLSLSIYRINKETTFLSQLKKRFRKKFTIDNSPERCPERRQAER